MQTLQLGWNMWLKIGRTLDFDNNDADVADAGADVAGAAGPSVDDDAFNVW